MNHGGNITLVYQTEGTFYFLFFYKAKTATILGVFLLKSSRKKVKKKFNLGLPCCETDDRGTERYSVLCDLE